MSRGRARAQTVERLENELEALLVNLQAVESPSSPFSLESYEAVDTPEHGALLGEGGATTKIDSTQHATAPSSGEWASLPSQHNHYSPPAGGGRRVAPSEQELEALLARLDQEEQQIREDIKRTREAYARSLRRGYLARGGGGGKSPPTETSPSSVPSSSTRMTESSEDVQEAEQAERQLQEAERKVSVLKRRAEEVRKSLMAASQQRVALRLPTASTPGGGSGFGSGIRPSQLGPAAPAGAIIGSSRRGAVEPPKPEPAVEPSVVDNVHGNDEAQRRAREADGRVRVTLETAKLLLRDEAARRQEEESREAERRMHEQRDRAERLRIMSQVARQRPPQAADQLTPHLATSPLTPPAHLPPLSPAPNASALPVTPPAGRQLKSPSAVAASASPLMTFASLSLSAANSASLSPLPALSPGPSPSAAPRQFYYTTTPMSTPMPPLPRPSVAPLPSAPAFSPRTVSGGPTYTAPQQQLSSPSSSLMEEDADLNSMMADMLKHLKATQPQTDVKELAASPPWPPAVVAAVQLPTQPTKTRTIAAAPTSSDACGRCGKAVSEYGDCVQAMQRRWHPACFTCFACKGELMSGYGPRGGGFYTRDGQPYCTGCYRRACGQ